MPVENNPSSVAVSEARHDLPAVLCDPPGKSRHIGARIMEAWRRRRRGGNRQPALEEPTGQTLGTAIGARELRSASGDSAGLRSDTVVYIMKEKKKSKSKRFHKFFWPCMLFTIKLILVLIGFFGYWFYRSPPSPVPITTSASASNSVKVHLPPGQLCPNEWSYFNFTNQCYKYYQQKWSFRGAEKFCAGKGAHLVSIHSKEENDFVAGISEIEGVGANRSAIWIGGHSPKKDEVFVWTDDSPMDFTWFIPTPVMHENCLEMYNCAGWMLYCWASTQCDNFFRTGYVCKMDANSN